jgi:hypothetical protein
MMRLLRVRTPEEVAAAAPLVKEYGVFMALELAAA